jgi:iron complex transport system permease protein
LPSAVLAAGLLLLAGQARAMNALLVGDETAASLGIDVERVRRILFALTSLVTGVMVSLTGAIGFVGLVVPHAVRLLVGSDHRRVLPVAVLGGGAFLVLVDVVARVALAPAELPVGVVTAVIGSPVFLWLLSRRGLLGGVKL